MSTISIIPISDSSRVLAERILASYPEAKILPFGSFSKEVFHESSSLVFIGAMEFAYAVSLPSRKINIPIRPWFV